MFAKVQIYKKQRKITRKKNAQFVLLEVEQWINLMYRLGLTL